MRAEYKTACYVVLLFCLVAIPYIPALQSAFVYDDHGSIVENAFLTTPESVLNYVGLRYCFNDHVPDGRRPVVAVSYVIDKLFWNENPFGFHLTNLLLHLAVVVLFFLCLCRWKIMKPPFAWWSALLFGMHPVLTEVVHVPAFREDVLCTLFMLLFMFASVRKVPCIWLAVISLILALLSKETAVIAPLLLLWLMCCSNRLLSPWRDVLLHVRGWRTHRSTSFQGGASKTSIELDVHVHSSTRTIIISFAIVLIYIITLLMSSTLQSVGRDWNGLSLQFPQNLFTLPWLFLRSVKLLLVPYPLSADYVIQPVCCFSDPRYLTGILMLIVWCILTIRLYRKHRALALGLGWMLIAYIPVANIIPLFNPYAERYLYTMAIGYAIALTSLVMLLKSGSLKSVIFIALTVVYMLLAMTRLGDWKDDITLWTRTLKTQPSSARAHTWVGIHEQAQGKVDRAVSHFEEAAQLNPQDAKALVNLAIIYGRKGDLGTAEQLLQEAAQRQPSSAHVWWNMVVLKRHQQQYSDATRYMEKSLEADPYYVPALQTMIEYKKYQGDHQAVLELQQRLRLLGIKE